MRSTSERPRSPADRHLAVAEYRAEDVVEVVRDAARERAERFEPLCLAQPVLGDAQRLLGVFLLGDVHRRAGPAHRLAARVSQAHPGHVQPTHAVGPHHPDLQADARRLAPEMSGHLRLVPRAVFRMERKLLDDLRAAAPLLVRREAAELVVARRAVILVGQHVPIPVAFAGRLHRERIALFRQAQRLLRLPARGHFAHESRPACRLSSRVALAERLQPDPALGGTGQANLDVDARALAGEICGDRFFPALLVVGLEGMAPQEVRPAGELRIGRQAVDLEHARRRIEIVAGDDPVPVALVARLHGERVALLRAP